MTAMLLYLAALGTVIAVWLSRQRLMSKPWLEVGVAGVMPGTGASRVPAVKLGLWVIIAVAGALLTLFVSAYLMRKHMSHDWQSLRMPPILWVNTAILALASLALHRAQVTARDGERRGMLLSLAAAWITTLAFLGGQYLAWRAVMGEGFLLATNPSSSFFYLITAVHALHLAGGMVALARTSFRAMSFKDGSLTNGHGAAMPRLRLSIELCATYWHFLLVAWLVLFGLLLHG